MQMWDSNDMYMNLLQSRQSRQSTVLYSVYYRQSKQCL